MGSFAVVVLMFAHIYVVQCGTVAQYGLCTQTSECVPDKGLSCVHTWTTCANGQCDCSDEEVWIVDRCQPKLYLGSDCDAINIASVDLAYVSCVGGKVTCDNGYTEVDKRCRQGMKGLEEECSTSSDCYTKRAECLTESGASPKTCVCETNYKKVGNNCKKAQINEACTTVDDCESSSKMVCGADKKCWCVPSRVPYDGECKEDGSKPVNETCSAGSDDCRLGLSCKRCPGESETRCLRRASRDNSTVRVNEACSSTSDCIVQVGLTCNFPHPTCSKGTCQCSATNIWDVNKCQPKLSIGFTCTASSTLPSNSACSDGKVKCNPGYTAVGNKECLAGTKSLDEDCGSSSDCYDIYSDCRIATGDTDKTCICETNYKNVDNICRKANLDEACSEVEDCASDTMICGPSNTCTCKSTLQKYEGACIETGTAALNETCGTVDSTCVLGLTCASCPDESERRCLEAPTTGPKTGTAALNETCGTVDSTCVLGLTCASCPDESERRCLEAPTTGPIDVTTPSGAELCVPVAVNLLLAVGLAVLGKETLLQ